MATTVDQKIDALEEALASGTLSVSYDGRSVTYRSQADLQAALEYFKSQRDNAAGTKSVRVSVGAYYRS